MISPSEYNSTRCPTQQSSPITTLCRKTSTREWIVDADLESAFDRIDHDRLLATIGDFPAREWSFSG
ncbi:RNA-dependent RNA polymerase family protein [Mycolicibacterium vanbaalenii]|uniref:hypothetical protein n=1 Tax=Mycolicibacterium vanbaalenii TaxID=110539 RepID=UPI0002D579B9|nr:hypothetical protein [Mycolicibacterium vanbaalenii]MCV7129411.1 hypothetical protein [Mycolicibacterium vanbaalenii PYR-1]